MKYEFEPYKTRVENGTFYLPEEFLKQLRSKKVYVYKHPDGLTVVGDESYVEYLWNETLSYSEKNRFRVQRFVLSRLFECRADDVVEILVKNCGFLLGENVIIKSGKMTVVILREGQDVA